MSVIFLQKTILFFVPLPFFLVVFKCYNKNFVIFFFNIYETINIFIDICFHSRWWIVGIEICIVLKKVQFYCFIELRKGIRRETDF